MELWEEIIATYVEIKPTDNFESLGIFLQNNGDGAYIAKWEYSKPLTKELQKYLRK